MVENNIGLREKGDINLKLKNILFSTIALFLVFCLSPKISYANEPDSYHLLQVTETIDLDEGITIVEGTYLYGKLEDSVVRIQFSNGDITIPFSSVEEVNNHSSSLEFIYINTIDGMEQTLSKDTKVYSTETFDRGQLLINKEISYPVFKDELGITFIYIGNLKYVIINEDKETDSEVELEIPNIPTEEVEEVVLNQDDELVEDSSDLTGNEYEADDLSDSLNDEINQNAQKNTEQIDNENHKQPVRATTSFSTLQRATTSSADPWKGVSTNYFKVTKDDLVVYDNRGGGPLKPIGKLKKNQVYPRVSDYGNWHRIQYGNIYGYVRKADTIPDNGSILKNKNSAYKNQSRSFKALKDVVIYDNTSGSLVPYGVIDKGQSYPIATDYGNWWRIVFSDRVGYVRKSDVDSEFLKSDKYFRAEGNIPIYDNRSGSLKKVGELKKGQIYPRVSDYGNWHRIQFGDIYGYVRKSDTSVASGSSIKNLNKNYTNQSRTFTALETATVYDNTSGKLVPFGTIDKGATFPIATDYGNWWRIVFSDRVGYVRKSDVESEFIKSDKYFKAEGNIPIYDNRSGSLKKVGELKKGQIYPRVSDYGNWHRIQFGDIYGYVRKSDTSVTSGSSIKNLNKNYKNQSRTFTALEAATVYDNTSGKLVPFGTIDKGATFPIATDYGNWWRVIFSDRIGYVRKSSVHDSVEKNVKIFIDPGHGGNDSGATGNGLREKDLTLAISKSIADYLINNYSNVEVRLSRTNDTFITLEDRAKMANSWKADYFLSAHINAGGGTGFESYVHPTNNSNQSKKYQDIVHENVAKEAGERDRGKKTADFSVLRNTNMPAILIEYLFIDSKSDSEKLKQQSYINKLGKATAEGIAKAFNLKRK